MRNQNIRVSSRPWVELLQMRVHWHFGVVSFPDCKDNLSMLVSVSVCTFPLEIWSLAQCNPVRTQLFFKRFLLVFAQEHSVSRSQIQPMWSRLECKPKVVFLLKNAPTKDPLIAILKFWKRKDLQVSGSVLSPTWLEMLSLTLLSSLHTINSNN